MHISSSKEDKYSIKLTMAIYTSWFDAVSWKNIFLLFLLRTSANSRGPPPPPQYKGSGRWFVQLHAVRRASSLCLSTFLMYCVYGFVFSKIECLVTHLVQLRFLIFQKQLFFSPQKLPCRDMFLKGDVQCICLFALSC